MSPCVASSMLWKLACLIACQAAVGLDTSCTAREERDPSTLLQTSAQLKVDLKDVARDRIRRGVEKTRGQPSLADHGRDQTHSDGHGNNQKIESLFLHPYDLSTLNVRLPDNYDGKTPLPLVVLLHGYSSWPKLYMKLFGLQGTTNTEQFIQVTPPGRRDSQGFRSWQAWGGACGNCGDYKEKPCCGDGDVSYIRNVIYALTRNLNVDPERIYVNGHSDGGAMAYRLACDAADIIAGVMILAGAPPQENWKPGYSCKPSQPVSVLHIHCTEDEDAVYKGNGKQSPGAVASVEMFASLNACTKHGQGWFSPSAAKKSKTSSQEMRLLKGSVKNDTEVYSAVGCKGGADVELWKVLGGSHNPPFVKQSYQDYSLSWLFRHRRSTPLSVTLADHTKAAPSRIVPLCVDRPIAWEDSDSNRCQTYELENWCNRTRKGGYGAGWKDSRGWFSDYAANGTTAEKACCVCGGGSNTSRLDVQL